MHSQMVKGRRQQVKQNKEHNRSVIKNFLEQLTFLRKKLDSSRKLLRNYEFLSRVGRPRNNKKIGMKAVRDHITCPLNC